MKGCEDVKYVVWSYCYVILRRMMLGRVVGFIEFTLLPVDVDLFLNFSTFELIKSHVHMF